MIKTILGLLSIALISCINSGDKAAPDDSGKRKLIGYSAGRTCLSCGKAAFDSLKIIAWEIYTDSSSTTKFYLYGNIRVWENLGFFSGGQLYSILTTSPGAPLFDEGDQCLNFDQPKKDTVEIDGKKVIVDLVQEPCMPYLLDKDIP